MPKVAVVIGAGRGLGRELVRQLVGQGTTVFAGVRALSRGGDQPDREPDAIAWIEADYDRPETLAAAAETVDRAAGMLHLLVNCGAVNRARGQAPAAVKGPVGQLRASALASMFTTNAIGPILATQAFWPLLRRTEHSMVVNITTQRARFSLAPAVGTIGYAASKAALNMATRILAAEAGGDGPAVVAIDPGWMATAMGGPEAPMTPEAAASKILHTLSALPVDAAGRLFRYDGEHLPW
jgi:NAD(P)-dependent dehydrogenase (short-subunit alcohol dehydrogenase family)